MNENNTRKILLAVFTVALVFLVGGVSYAMYSFAGTGAKVNTIVAGQISIEYDEKTTITIQGRYPETDVVGFNNTDSNSVMTFDINSNNSEGAIVNYAIAIDDVTMQQGTTLKEK